MAKQEKKIRGVIGHMKQFMAKEAAQWINIIAVPLLLYCPLVNMAAAGHQGGDAHEEGAPDLRMHRTASSFGQGICSFAGEYLAAVTAELEFAPNDPTDEGNVAVRLWAAKAEAERVRGGGLCGAVRRDFEHVRRARSFVRT